MSGAKYRIRRKWNMHMIMDRISNRAKNRRISTNDTLLIRERTEGTIVYAWDSEANSTVLMTRRQWQQLDPAILYTEACYLLRISDSTFDVWTQKCAIKPKKCKLGVKRDEIPRRYPRYYSVEDLCLIADSVAFRKSHATSYELRELFRLGYISYKQTRSGEWIPVWDESIF